ncbi:MAG: DinB family protein [Chloroflexi bacterium]|nr:DinB family protein [Chloroflexota bacterium]
MGEDRRQKLEAYSLAADEFAAAVATVPQEALPFKPKPESWSVQEVITHLADIEANNYVRFRTVAVRPGALVQGVDADEWANALRYERQNAGLSLDLFRLLRRANYELLICLPDDVWTHPMEHSERGRITLEQLFDGGSRHIAAHIRQIEEIVAAWRAAQQR